MSNITKAHDITIEEYLSYSELKIPLFQRGYVWNAEEISEFWSDLTEDGVQFLGSIILKDENYNQNKKTGFLEIVDGQQRTISTLLLLKTISRNLLVLAKTRKFQYEQNAEKQAEEINRLISKRDRFDLTKVLSYKLTLPTDSDNQALKEILDGNLFTYKNNREYKNFYLAQEKLNQLFDTFLMGYKTSVEKIDYLINLKNNILDIKIIEVLVPTDEDAYMIFETVNDRGADLGAAELLKNHLFAHSQKDNQQLIQDEWQNIKKTLSQIGKRSIDVTNFLRYYWIGKYEHLSKRKLFKGIKDKLKSKTKSDKQIISPDLILEEIKNFRKTLERIFISGLDDWRDLFDDFKKDEDRRQVQRRAHEWFSYKRNLDYFTKSIQYLPVYTAVVGNIEKIKLSERSFLDLLLAVEKINFLYSYILQKPTNKIDKMLSGIGRNILSNIELGDSNNIRKSVQKGCSEIEKFMKENVNQEEINMALASLNWNKSSDKSIIYFILINIEYVMGGYSRILVQEDLTLEHIYPKSVEKKGVIENWSVLDFEYSELGHGLGNLTLLPSSGPHANGSAGEEGFEIKKNNFLLPSSYSSNRYFKDIENWNGEEINKRLKFIQDKVWEHWGSETVKQSEV